MHLTKMLGPVLKKKTNFKDQPKQFMQPSLLECLALRLKFCNSEDAYVAGVNSF